jgi:hypothetical protein
MSQPSYPLGFYKFQNVLPIYGSIRPSTHFWLTTEGGVWY